MYAGCTISYMHPPHQLCPLQSAAQTLNQPIASHRRESRHHHAYLYAASHQHQHRVGCAAARRTRLRVARSEGEGGE